MSMEMHATSDLLRRQACDPCRKRKVRCSRHDAPLCERCSHFGLNCEYSPTKTMGRPRRRRSEQFGSNVPGAFMGLGPLTDGTQQAAFGEFGPGLLSFDAGFSPGQSALLWNAGSPQPAAHDAGREAMDPLGAAPPPDQPPTAAAAFPRSQDDGTDGNLPAPPSETSERRPNKCPCVVMVNQHFSMVDDSPQSFRTVKLLQESVRSAEKILTCSVCFNPDNLGNAQSGLSKNVHLLGSLMSSIAALYGGFVLYQKRRAHEYEKRSEQIRVVLGELLDEPSVVAISLNGQDYWAFLKAAMTSEFSRLLGLYDAFADRQTRLHSQGHEACELGSTCTRTEVCSPVSEPADACPTKVDDIRSHFSCFRTVEQVHSAIQEAQGILAS